MYTTAHYNHTPQFGDFGKRLKKLFGGSDVKKEDEETTGDNIINRDSKQDEFNNRSFIGTNNDFHLNIHDTVEKIQEKYAEARGKANNKWAKNLPVNFLDVKLIQNGPLTKEKAYRALAQLAGLTGEQIAIKLESDMVRLHNQPGGSSIGGIKDFNPNMDDGHIFNAMGISSDKQFLYKILRTCDENGEKCIEVISKSNGNSVGRLSLSGEVMLTKNNIHDFLSKKHRKTLENAGWTPNTIPSKKQMDSIKNTYTYREILEALTTSQNNLRGRTYTDDFYS